MATALPLVNVTVRLVDQDGDPIIGAKVSAKLTTVERYQGYVIPQEYLGQTDDQGTCIVRLFPNELGTEGSEYRFKINYSTTQISGVNSPQSCHISGTGCYSSGGKTLTVYASIPNSDCNLEDVCDLDPYPVRGSGQLFTEQVLAAAQQASTAATEAEDAAAQIKLDVEAAKDSAEDAKNSADIATSKASIATAGADRAQLKADVADARAKSAESWAEKAKAWAESDTPPDPDDPDSKSSKSWAKSITIATPDKPGLVAPQVGSDDGLEQTPDGKLKVTHASETQRGSVLTSNTAKKGTVPVAGEDGKLDSSWFTTGLLPLGYIYAWPYSTPMDGSIQINGQLLNRQLYANLFAYAQSHGQVITEAEWQEKAAQQGGYCAFYSEGDGSTTFRAPKFAPYQKFTMVSSDAGKYYKAGAPNITGNFYVQAHGGNDTQPHFFVNSSGALYSTDGTQNAYTAGGGSSNLHKESLVNFDASRSNSIYGNSTTVTPESMDWIVCVVAFGVATNVGSVDVANVMTAVGQVQADVNKKLDASIVHIVDTWKGESSWYRKWSDGRIEQGGKIQITSSQQQVSFPTPFTSQPTVIPTRITTRADNSYDNQIYPQDVKSTYFIVAMNTNNLTDAEYYAFGY